jgi:hypothetical protein
MAEGADGRTGTPAGEENEAYYSEGEDDYSEGDYSDDYYDEYETEDEELDWDPDRERLIRHVRSSLGISKPAEPRHTPLMRQKSIAERRAEWREAKGMERERAVADIAEHQQADQALCLAPANTTCGTAVGLEQLERHGQQGTSTLQDGPTPAGDAFPCGAGAQQGLAGPAAQETQSERAPPSPQTDSAPVHASSSEPARRKGKPPGRRWPFPSTKRGGAAGNGTGTSAGAGAQGSLCDSTPKATPSLPKTKPRRS